jgi:isopenicillin N synthase-like dioxygenase
MLQSVPLIDLTPFYQLDREAPEVKQLLCQLEKALTETGFLCVTGTQVKAEQVSKAQEVALSFFDLTDEEKDQVKARRYSHRGYTGLAELGLSYAMDAVDLKKDHATPPDLFERYRIGPVDEFPADCTSAFKDTAYAPNLWPTQPQAFEATMQNYYRQMNQLAQDLLKLFALTLGLTETWFEGKIDRSMGSLAINHYPAQVTAPLPGQLRAGPHTDYGTLTIVAPTAAPGGLQIRTHAGHWEDVQIAPGTFVVNIGDMMAQWTNDRWVSTVHRVANPPQSSGPAGRRLSLVFFHQPNPDALIECIPTCVTPTQPAKYQPVLAGEYITAKISRHFKSYLAA